MTAEVAVMNRLAVALAADSAVTISRGETSKVFPNENKIFELSSHRPVGLMTYHSTQFFGVPWEIIAKDFRRARPHLSCPDLLGWVQEFKDFVMQSFCPPDQAQQCFVKKLIKDAFLQVNERFQERQFSVLFPKMNARRKRLQDKDVRAEFHNAIEDVTDNYAEFAESDTISEEDARDWLGVYKREFDELYREQFGRFPLRDEERSKIEDLAVRVLKSGRPGDFTTGLVFAGFGDTDLFPTLQCIEINGVVAGNLRVVDLEYADIDRADNTAAVIPFAERDTVDSLLFGRSIDYEKQVVAHFREVLEQTGDALVDSLARGASRKRDFKARVRDAAREAIDRFRAEVSTGIDKAFSEDILDIVRHMPKQEIAAFAESLVSVSSVKRKVTVGPETVGGPIDVAVISRHEGFVWVRRKFYFTPDLNPRYIHRTFRSESGAEDGRGHELERASDGETPPGKNNGRDITKTTRPTLGPRSVARGDRRKRARGNGKNSGQNDPKESRN